MSVDLSDLDSWDRITEYVRRRIKGWVELAREEGRREAIGQALAILHDTGWLGASEQRIRNIIDPMPEGEPHPAGTKTGTEGGGK